MCFSTYTTSVTRLERMLCAVGQIQIQMTREVDSLLLVTKSRSLKVKSQTQGARLYPDVEVTVSPEC